MPDRDTASSAGIAAWQAAARHAHDRADIAGGIPDRELERLEAAAIAATTTTQTDIAIPAGVQERTLLAQATIDYIAAGHPSRSHPGIWTATRLAGGCIGLRARHGHNERHDAGPTIAVLRTWRAGHPDYAGCAHWAVHHANELNAVRNILAQPNASPSGHTAEAAAAAHAIYAALDQLGAAGPEALKIADDFARAGFAGDTVALCATAIALAD